MTSKFPNDPDEVVIGGMAIKKSDIDSDITETVEKMVDNMSTSSKKNDEFITNAVSNLSAAISRYVGSIYDISYRFYEDSRAFDKTVLDKLANDDIFQKIMSLSGNRGLMFEINNYEDINKMTISIYLSSVDCGCSTLYIVFTLRDVPAYIIEFELKSTTKGKVTNVIMGKKSILNFVNDGYTFEYASKNHPIAKTPTKVNYETFRDIVKLCSTLKF